MKSDEVSSQRLTIRNSFIMNARPLDEDVIKNLRTALLIVNVHDGFFKSSTIEEKSFSHITRVAGSGGELFVNALVDARNANRHVRAQLKKMALNGQAMNYLFDRGKNSDTENSLIAQVLDRAILMINPLKKADRSDGYIRTELKRLNDEYAPLIHSELERIKTGLSARFVPKPEEPSLIAKARRSIASLRA